MKDICVLEVSPMGPIENHVNIFKNVDWFYVTHDKPVLNDNKFINCNYKNGKVYCWGEVRYIILF